MTDATERTVRVEGPDGGGDRAGLAGAHDRFFAVVEGLLDRPPATGGGFHRSERTERLFVPDVSSQVTRRQ